MKQEKLDKLDEIEKDFFEKEETKNMRNPKSKQAIILVLLGVLFVLIGSTYALVVFNADLKGNKENSISTCSLNLKFKENNPVTLLTAYPIADDKALSFTPYELVVSNNNGSCTNVTYTLTFEDLCESCTQSNSVCTTPTGTCNCLDTHKIDSSLIRYQVIDVTNGSQSYLDSDPYKFSINGTLDSATDSNTYQIRLWISKDAVNNDLYVYDANGDIAVDSNGGYVTRNFCTKVKANINAS